MGTRQLRKGSTSHALAVIFRMLFSFAALSLLTACFDSSSLVGGSSSTNAANETFEGCLTAEAVNTSSIDVAYEWPSGASSIAVLRNGIGVFSSVSGDSGILTDDGLLEGRTYTYSCTATFTSLTGVSTVKYGSNVLSATTISINSPTFSGISSVTLLTPSSARVNWTIASGVPTHKYVVVAKLGSAPTSDDFDSSLAATQTLISAKKLKRVEVLGSGSSQTTITGLGDQLSYQFAVQACTGSNVCTSGDGVSDIVTKTMDDDGAPQTVGASFAQIVSSQVVLTAPWDPSLGSVSIRKVYRNTTGGTDLTTYTNVQNITVSDATNVTTELTLSGSLAEATTYYYIVRDEDSLGQLSPNTAVQSVNTGDLTSPPSFAGVKPAVDLVSTVQGQMLVKWYAPADWTDYKGFKIYTVNDDSSLTFRKDCTCTSGDCATNHLTECTVTDLNAYRTYKFHVRAFDASGNITTYLNPVFNYTEKQVIDTTVPVFASGLSSSYVNGVLLNWSAASDNQYASEPGAVINYQVWRKTGSTFATPTNPAIDADGGAPLVTQSSRTYTDTTVTAGATYRYTICALDTSGNRKCDGNVESISVGDNTPPTLSIADDKTTTSKTWALTFTMSDDSTTNPNLAVVVRRKVATTATDFPTTATTIWRSLAGMTTLASEGDPVISGTENLDRYVNYLVIVADQAGNSVSATYSIHLDNLPPSSVPVFTSFTPTSPSSVSLAPVIKGTVSANTSTVAFYSNSGCTTSIGSGTKAAYEGSSGITLTVSANTTTSVYAQASTSAASLGACTLLSTYRHDNVAPTVASLTIGGAATSGATISRSVTWGTLSETIATYCYRLSTTPTSESTAGCTWVASTSLPSTLAGTASVDGTYSFVAWVRDGANNTSTRIVSSNSLTVDASAPAWTNSVTGPVYTLDENSVASIGYTRNATDPSGSGVDKYQYAIGTTGPTSTTNCPASCYDMKAWTDVTPTSFTASSIATMDHATTYYINMRVVDVAGNYTTYGRSFVTDLINPSAPNITSHSENSSVTIPATGLVSLTGTCDSSAGNVTTVTGGTSVTIVSSSCLSSTLTVSAKVTDVDFGSAKVRTVSAYTTKPSTRVSSTGIRNLSAMGICPQRYVAVPGNSTYGTKDFCISKYEAGYSLTNPALDTTGLPTLANSGNGYTTYNTAWFPDSRSDYTSSGAYISQRQAVVACDKLNTTNDGSGPYQLISNDQWMTAASNIIAQSTNWSSGTVGSGLVNYGYGSGFVLNMFHTLSNGDTVKDLAGGGGEWVRFTNPEGLLDTGIAGNTAARYNSRYVPRQATPDTVGNATSLQLGNPAGYSAIYTCAGAPCTGAGSINPLWFQPTGTFWNNTAGTYPSSFNLGTLGGVSQAINKAINRGGWTAGNSGLYYAELGYDTSYVGGHVRFRCSYQPRIVPTITAGPADLSTLTAPGAMWTGTCDRSATHTIHNDNPAVTMTVACKDEGRLVVLADHPATNEVYNFYVVATYPDASEVLGTERRITNTSNACPTFYTRVPGDINYDTKAFCVSKFEMKAVTTNPTLGAATLAGTGDGNITYGSGSTCTGSNASGCYPDARPDGTPWVNITNPQAVIRCDKLNTTPGGTGPYQLITNDQWQTMATNVANVNANWSGGTVRSGKVALGHGNSTDSNAVINGLQSSATSVLAAMTTTGLYSSGTNYAWSFATTADEWDAGYRGTGNSAVQAVGSGWEQRRTNYLSTGQVVWDIAGNSQDWARFTNLSGIFYDDDTGTAGYQLGGYTNSASTFNYRFLPSSYGGWIGLSDTSACSASLANSTIACVGVGNTNPNWYRPIGGTWNSPPADLSAVNFGYVVTSAGGVSRGGTVQQNTFSNGIFAMAGYDHPASIAVNANGFRCAYSP